jgi:steroid delta-isomerase-like uncharacterized protein
MESQSPGALARRLYEITSSGAFEKLEEVLAPDVVDHGVGGEEGTLSGIQSVRQSLAEFRASFPDSQVTIEDLLESGERVAVRWTVRGTHSGAFHGIPPTGRTIRLSGTDVIRTDGGRIVERWGNSDELGLLQQLVDRRTGDRRGGSAGVPGVPGTPDERRRNDRRRSAGS